MEKPNYEAMKTVEEVESEIETRKNTIVRQTKHKEQVESEKKDIVGGFNDELKVLKKSISHEIEVIDELERRKLELMGSQVLAPPLQPVQQASAHQAPLFVLPKPPV